MPTWSFIIQKKYSTDVRPHGHSKYPKKKKTYARMDAARAKQTNNVENFYRSSVIRDAQQLETEVEFEKLCLKKEQGRIDAVRANHYRQVSF